MSYEASDNAGQNDGGEGQDDGGLGASLAGEETTFVTGGAERQPVSRGTVVVTGLLLACGAATGFMYLRGGPRGAEAATPDAQQADATIQKFISGNQANAGLMKQLLKDTEKVVQQFRQQPTKTQVPLQQLATNPFRKDEAKPSEDAAAKLAEAARLAAEAARQKQREAAVAASNALRLQTIIHRDPTKATCMINNTLYRQGQKVDVFTIDEIRPDGVYISSGPDKFVLKMKP
jgi:hypothetical protein